jgi:hypothetical protein
MTTASQKTLQVLEQIVKVVPVGTNLALLQTEKSAPFGHRFLYLVMTLRGLEPLTN